MTHTSGLQLISSDVIAQTPEYARRFAPRAPFRHVVIDNFLSDDFAAQLLREFPPFERGNSRTENGGLGNKSTVERIRELGSSFKALDDLIQSREFLDLVGRITSIPDLLYDPWYFGGGTHESRESQDLDPHVDFNRHPVEHWHRRLNLIVYLNHEWEDAWGGSLDLHSDPRERGDRIIRIAPLYNRCVIFETTETSWHGFSRIVFPESRKQLTRKSIALYFYTRERPPEEIADTHSTIYVDRPLPDRFREGATLSADDVAELQALLARRDQHNQRLYGDITRVTRELEEARRALESGILGGLRLLVRHVRRGLRR
jgi:hypothetical protein